MAAEGIKKGPDSGPLVIRVGRGYLAAYCAGWLGPLVGFGADALFEHGAKAVFGLVVFVVFGAFGVAVVFLAVQRVGRDLARLDDSGIALAGGRTVAWGEISVVRHERKREWEGLVFVPRDRVELPILLGPLFPFMSAHSYAQRLTSHWGSPLVLFPRYLNVSSAQVIDAVRRFGGGVPMHDERDKGTLSGGG